MAINTMGYMVPVEVHERQKAINRDLAAGFSYDEASRRNDPNHVPYPNRAIGLARPVADYGPTSPAYIDAPGFEVESAPEPAWVTEHKKRSAQFDSPGMSLADLFDNRLWETYEVDAVPKRGGRVERRRYIGNNPTTVEGVGVDYGPTQPDQVRQKGVDSPGGIDIFDIKPRGANYPYASGDQWIGSDNVWRSPFGMSYPVEDASRHHMRYNPGGHRAPLKKSEWSLGTLYDDAGATQARRLDHGRSRAAEAAAAPTIPEEQSIVDKIIESLPIGWDESKQFGHDVSDWVEENLLPPGPVTEDDAEKEWLESQRNAGVSNPASLPEYTRDPDEPLESTTLGGVLGHTLWDKLKYLKGLGVLDKGGGGW